MKSRSSPVLVQSIGKSKKILLMPLSLRNNIYWFVDYIKGSRIRKHFDAIKKIHGDHGSDYSIRERQRYLSEILRHCLDTVPYYKNLGVKNPQLEQFPVVDKNIIRESPDSFCSYTYLDKKNHKVSTSGSTGTPFTVLHDTDKRRRHTADLRFYWESVGHTWGSRLIYLRIWNRQNRKSKLVQKKQNIVPVDVFKLDDKRIQELLGQIKKEGAAKSILGYASALDVIAKYLKKDPIDRTEVNLSSIVAMSESLDRPTKKNLEEYFGCPVVSRYANTENGMLAQQTQWSGNDFLVNLASYHVEILDLNEDVPVKEGEMGRIVVTDLFNRAMPLIRYDTGDLGVLGTFEKDNRSYTVFKRVEGRKMDIIYDTKGEPISSFTITNNLWKYNELVQYQFIQNSKNEYEFKLNCPGKFQKKSDLIKEFEGYLGHDAVIKVTFVNEIPLLSSGKRKKVLNNYSPPK